MAKATAAALPPSRPQPPLSPAYAGVGQDARHACVGVVQHEPVSTQASPAGQLALLVQGVMSQSGPVGVTQTTLPSVLRVQRQSVPPDAAHGLGMGVQDPVCVAGQMLTGKQAPA